MNSAKLLNTEDKRLAIYITRGECFDRLSFQDADEFNSLATHIRLVQPMERTFVFSSSDCFIRMIAEFGQDVTPENLEVLLNRSVFLGDDRMLRNKHIEHALIQASPIKAFPYSNIMQHRPEYAIKVLELDFSHICNIRPGLLLQEEYAAAIVRAFPVRMGWALEGDGATGLSKLLTRDGVYSCAYMSYDSVAPGALVKLLHHWLSRPEMVRDFPGYISKAARNWEFEFNHEHAVNNVRQALSFAHKHVSTSMVCNLIEHVYKHNRDHTQLHKICRVASQHPWPTRLHLPFKIVKTWLMDTVVGNAAITTGLQTMKVAAAAAEGKDIHMKHATPPHDAGFELVRREEGSGRQTRLLVPTRQALEEAVEGRAANSLLTTKSDTTCPDHFLLNARFLSEYLATNPAQAATPGTYNVQRPYSDELGYFTSDSMFASRDTRAMLPAPDASEGMLPGFGIYELISGFHELLNDSFDFFNKECVEVNLDIPYAPGPLLFVGTFEEDEKRVFVEATFSHTAGRAKVLFQQFRERCGVLLHGRPARVLRTKLNRWDLYGVILKKMSHAMPFQKRNQALSLTRQIMRLITQEKHAAQMNRHVRLVAAEIRSLANKMEVIHTGEDMLGEPLFGGLRQVAYTIKGCQKAFKAGEHELLRLSEGPPKPRRVYGKGNKTTPPTSSEPSAETTTAAIFKDQGLPAEVSQALSDLVRCHKHLHEHSHPIQEPPMPVGRPPTLRGTRILRLMFEREYDWAPILRRIAGYIYTPTFERVHLPIIVQTQVARKTRAQRKVCVLYFFIASCLANRLRSSGTKSRWFGAAEARALRPRSPRRRRGAGLNMVVSFTKSSSSTPCAASFRRRPDWGPRGAGPPPEARIVDASHRPSPRVRLPPGPIPLETIKNSRISPTRSS